jgi:hypothetical protein
MKFRMRYLVILLLAVSTLRAKMVIMPAEIGVSCQKRKPFTATARTTLSRVFASGNQRTVTVEDHIARDADGRVMREQHLPWTEDPAQPVYYINILDPKSMQRIHIDPQNRTVVTKAVDRGHAWDYVPYDGSQYRIATKPGVTVHTEMLKNQEINGLKCWGQRTTYLYQPGTLHGNQQPLTRTWEVWYAKELGADVRIVEHNPDAEAGDQQTDLADIKYGEPDPAMFAAPAGYEQAGRP